MAKFYARYSRDGKRKQLLKEHLKKVSSSASYNASKICLPILGKYLGLLHDIGKYKKEFQDYLEASHKSDKTVRRGDVQHAINGAQYIVSFIKSNSNEKEIFFLVELSALCAMSHHVNLIDMLDLEGNNNFAKKIENRQEQDKLDEILQNMDKEVKEELSNIDIKKLCDEIKQITDKISATNEIIPKNFHLGMVAKFLISCLIDADHQNSSDFELGCNCEKQNDEEDMQRCWKIISDRVEEYLSKLNAESQSASDVKEVRKLVSDDCLNSGKTFEKGCYKLEVPTGGGKTLASFRFAVEMAKKHKYDRIIYCIPYTTIIEQNADVIRKIVEIEENEKGKIVLEHHSNLFQKNQTQEQIDLNEMLMQNWDAQIIFTTNVQILEILFGGKTTNTRLLNKLANSVIIFDEIQTLPIKCVHIFNNAINFLVEHCNMTAVLCTATQPLLDRVDVKRGAIKISDKCNIIDNIEKLFEKLQRVEIVHDLDNIKDEKFISEQAVKLANENVNCLVVCNTTKFAKTIFQKLQLDNSGIKIYHLSAKMCPTHRKEALDKIKNGLREKKKLIAVSTQVIEAGIDIDFNSGIRALAGLDSTAQAAGRINRNGLFEIQKLYTYEFKEELGNLEEIKIGKTISKRLFDEYGIKHITPDIMNKYYEHYFFKRANVMSYNVSAAQNLLEYISNNKIAVSEYKRTHDNKPPQICMKQSFKEAVKNFEAIDAPTIAVIVPYGDGQKIINELCGEKYDSKKINSLLKQAQRYSVNVYPCDFKKFGKAIKQISKELEIYYLEACYYSCDFGITQQPTLAESGFVLSNPKI
ncbi:MAG: CRISPR-associated helicase Cas3' [Endomicrobium sp.]|jgi:CRISPR-associated endonuclease/helicase Cas3|nr:CRISPR-associated helicase Cas3' [Endomicrobium sp.]